jgi:hypothetical protein
MKMVIAKWPSRADLSSLNSMDHSSKTDLPTVRIESLNSISIRICEDDLAC